MIVQMDQIVCGMLVTPSNSIIIANMDQSLAVYKDSGSKQLKMNTKSPIIQLADFVHEAKKIHGFMAALESKEILIYDQNKVILKLSMEVGDSSCPLASYLTYYRDQYSEFGSETSKEKKLPFWLFSKTDQFLSTY